MTSLVSKAAICFIACHGGPADHFATFYESLPKEIAAQIEIIAAGDALKKFKDRNIKVHMPITSQSAEEIAKGCSEASLVMTDVGHKFDIELQSAFATHAPETIRAAYYDNPEPYVPGGYSEVAARVMSLADMVLFANSNLAAEELFEAPSKSSKLGSQTKIGLGYFPKSKAEEIAKLRAGELPATLRKELGLKEHQKLLTYFGGNNDVYYAEAFPALMKIIEQANLNDCIFLIQQHPGAKAKQFENNYLKEKPLKNVIISSFNSDQAQTVCDAALYYQTSMSPQFMLAGIPTMQIGHDSYPDILVKNGLCSSITTASALVKALSKEFFSNSKTVDQEVIFKGLGIKEDWLQTLEKLLSSTK